MHSLEMIVFLNSKRMSARAHKAARLFNTGSDGHAKHGEKTGVVNSGICWETDESWEVRRKKRKKRRGY